MIELRSKVREAFLQTNRIKQAHEFAISVANVSNFKFLREEKKQTNSKLML